MRKIIMVLGILAILIFTFAQVYAAPRYIGSGKCKLCHARETMCPEKAYSVWEKTKHAQAYLTLASAEAKETAKKLNISDPQKSDKCLSCHVTAFAVDKSLKDSTLTIAEGISCEACHGPGSDYKSIVVMKDRQKAVAAGLIIPNEKTCITCHNEKSPNFKPFKYADMYKLIAHPLPKTVPAEKKG